MMTKTLIRLTMPHSVKIGDYIVYRYWHDAPAFHAPGYRRPAFSGWRYQNAKVTGIDRFGSSWLFYVKYSKPDGDRMKDAYTSRLCKPGELVPVVLGSSMPLYGEADE